MPVRMRFKRRVRCGVSTANRSQLIDAGHGSQNTSISGRGLGSALYKKKKVDGDMRVCDAWQAGASRHEAA